MAGIYTWGLTLCSYTMNGNNASNIHGGYSTGIKLDSSNYNTLSSNTANSNFDAGIWLTSSNNNTLRSNIISNTIGFGGIWLMSSSNNTIYDNYFKNTRNFSISNSVNKWNIPKTFMPGRKNIIGGLSFGGNFWANPDGTGFSQTCTADNDGFCDKPFVLDGNNIDYLPLAQPTCNITVTSPNGEENWQTGTTQTIGWKYAGNCGLNVRIELLKGGVINSFIGSGRSLICSKE